MAKIDINKPEVTASIIGAAGVAGVGIAGAAATGHVISEGAEQIRTATEDALAQMDDRSQALLDQAGTQISGFGDEQQARMHGIGEELVARLTAAREELYESLRAGITEVADSLQQHLSDAVTSAINSGERELHRLAQDLEVELAGQKDRLMAEVVEAGRRAQEMLQADVDNARAHLDSLASSASAGINDRLASLDTQVHGAIDTINSARDVAMNEAHAGSGHVLIDQGANPEDDYDIG